MKAMILAAGKGTRLKPLTENKPKALLEIGGRTLLEIQIRKVLSAGIKDIIINVHHFADQIEQSPMSGRNCLIPGGALAKPDGFSKTAKPFLCIMWM